MKLYYARAKDGTDTLKVAGETLFASNPSAIFLVMRQLEKEMGDELIDFDICTVEVEILDRPKYGVVDGHLVKWYEEI